MSRRPCSISLHGEITASPERFAAELANHREWLGADLVIAECHCGSTLGLAFEPRDKERP